MEEEDDDEKAELHTSWPEIVWKMVLISMASNSIQTGTDKIPVDCPNYTIPIMDRRCARIFFQKRQLFGSNGEHACLPMLIGANHNLLMSSR